MKVVIIGGGVIGLATSYHLLKDGHDVTIVDAGEFGRGASHGNAGYIVPSDSGPVPAPGMVLKGLKWMLHRDSPLYVKPSLQPEFVRFMLALASRCNAKDFDDAYRANLSLCEEAADLLDGYAADGVEFEMHHQGYLSAYADSHNFEHRVAGLGTAREFGLAPEVWTAEEMVRHEPALRPDLAGGVYFPQDRHLRPDTLMNGLATRCRELGATLLSNNPVTGVRRDDRVRAVVTPDGEVEGDEFLLACGAYTAPVAKLFDTVLPIRPGKGYSLDYSPAPVSLTCSINLADAKVAVTPMDGRLRLAGTMEFAGLDTTVNEVRVQAITRAPSRYFAQWEPTGHSAPWAGARPMTPDGLPLIGRLPNDRNTWIAAGHGMLGVTLGPSTGKGLAAAISTGNIPSQLAPFTPQRYFSAAGRPRMRPRAIVA